MDACLPLILLVWLVMLAVADVWCYRTLLKFRDYSKQYRNSYDFYHRRHNDRCVHSHLRYGS